VPSTDSDDCDPGPLTEQIIKIIVEDCENENPPQVDSSFDQIFKDYPFLIKAIDPNACANEQITVYKGASGNLFYQIETELQTAVYSGEGNFLAIERANAPPLSDVYNYAEVLDIVLMQQRVTTTRKLSLITIRVFIKVPIKVV